MPWNSAKTNFLLVRWAVEYTAFKHPVHAISFRMPFFATHMLRDFARKPRPLREIMMWKATEL